MKEVFIRYNPYKVETEITIDGKRPKENSALNVKDKRLQEWIENLPAILREEENDNRFKLDFYGTVFDHEDVASVVNISKDVTFEYSHTEAKKDVREKIGQINNIFKEVVNDGPFDELKDDETKHAFDSAMNNDFEVYVIATMSAGKSTLINALLEQKLMPSKHEACTKVITRIKDTINDFFSAIVYDENGKEIERQNKLTLDIMKRLNDDPNVSTIKIEGHIPFITSGEISLVLVDTPGPNNASDRRHYETTHGMLAKSSKTLILFIMNAEQPRTTDDYNLLKTIAESMKVAGKQSKDRFIFVLNRLDNFNQEDGDSIESTLEKTRAYLNNEGIENPNIYPSAALPALDIMRFLAKDKNLTDFDIKKLALKVEEFNAKDEFHLDSPKYLSLPPSIRSALNNKLDEAKHADTNADYKTALIHTGIIPLQKAIEMYVTKYARPAKIKTLIDVFEKKLESAKTFEELKKRLISDKEQRKKFMCQIEDIEKKMADGENAQKFKDEINRVNLSDTVGDLNRIAYEKAYEQTRTAIEEISEKKLGKDEITAWCKKFESLTSNIEATLKENLGDKISEIVDSTAKTLIAIYKEKLASLTAEYQVNAILIDPLQLVGGQFNTETPERLYEKYKEKHKEKTGSHWEANPEWTWGVAGFFKTLVRPWEWAVEFDDYMEKEDVDGKTFAEGYFANFLSHIANICDEAEKYSRNITKFIKEDFGGKFDSLDSLLKKKMEDLKACTSIEKDLAGQIRVNEERLKWLEDIQGKLHEVLEI